MPKNVEVKAKLKDFNKVIQIASELCESNGQLLNQKDVFFNVSHGRLKLRYFEDGSSQLISYSRPDIEGPKLSDYFIYKVEDSNNLLQVLKSALGEIGIVKKTRYLFLYGQTRIHIDRVENLGDFLELEVVLTEDQNLADGESIVNQLLKVFEINNKDLITGAYLDLQ